MTTRACTYLGCEEPAAFVVTGSYDPASVWCDDHVGAKAATMMIGRPQTAEYSVTPIEGDHP